MQKNLITTGETMKKTRFFLTILAIIMLVAGLCACGKGSKSDPVYHVSYDTSKPTQLTVGDTVDFTEYFIVTDEDGNDVAVTNDMLDLSRADTSKVGKFIVTLTVGKEKLSITFTVFAKKADAVYHVELDTAKPTQLTVGDTVDYTKYFIVTDGDGNNVPVTNDMLDLTKADTSKPGTFTVTLTIGGETRSVTFTVVAKQDDEPPIGSDEAFAPYADRSAWNFAVTVTVSDSGNSYEDYYEYDGNRVLNTFLDENNDEYTDYWVYGTTTDTYTAYYYDNGDGTYTEYGENSDKFTENYAYCYLIDLTCLADFDYTVSGSVYAAKSPNDAGNYVIGEYEDTTWTSFTVTVTDGKIVKMVGKMSDGYTMEFAFSKHGKIRITLPDAEGGGSDVDPTPSGTMEKQTYDASTFDNERLQDKLLKTDGSIGLPSTGNYHALVIPVQFKGDTISQEQLDKLEIAFNGTEEQTGWESVKTYYQKASYGKLNLTFDIQDVYQAQNNATYYEKSIDGGDLVILNEALAYYENKLDLTQYDTNNDGAIDAVYLIYSADVDYNTADFYWAYVYWDNDTTTYDGKDVSYYLFAGFDFMDEKTENSQGSGYDPVPGMKINAETYIHESGHLLGLDDYYDYEETKGSNEGLGGADMMDYNIGDHGVYSKIMLGWLTPTIVTETTTVTLSPSATEGSAILIPLNFDNSYFCEYLLIDLYAATGLNTVHSDDLYGGAEYGVRIYHVASSIENPYQEDGYGSFTDNNNSVSENALVKLIEADGTKKFSNSGGSAAASDLWKAGQTFSTAFPKYTRYDNKLLNFDIAIGSVSATSATVTITFAD